MRSIPREPGFYALELRLAQPVQLHIGQIGEHRFPVGVYVYAGSALGPGGLRARLGRHLRAKEMRTHWHIDYLSHAAQADALAYISASPDEIRRFRAMTPDPGAVPIECLWSQALAKMPGASIPVRGFGASDCHSGCRAHLVAFPLPGFTVGTCMPLLSHPQTLRLLAKSAGVPLEALAFQPVCP